jgi:hypothetical protein
MKIFDINELIVELTIPERDESGINCYFTFTEYINHKLHLSIRQIFEVKFVTFSTEYGLAGSASTVLYYIKYI